MLKHFSQMWLFSRYSEVKKKLDRQDEQILELQHTVLGLVASNDNLINGVLRKIQKKKVNSVDNDVDTPKKSGMLTPEDIERLKNGTI